ncbi:MAG: hypothetical protein Q8R88_07090 [Desulfoprunum sp.]|nr:hypothetical protein [Desulfoprunum sp.]
MLRMPKEREIDGIHTLPGYPPATGPRRVAAKCRTESSWVGFTHLGKRQKAAGSVTGAPTVNLLDNETCAGERFQQRCNEAFIVAADRLASAASVASPLHAGVRWRRGMRPGRMPYQRTIGRGRSGVRRNCRPVNARRRA